MPHDIPTGPRRIVCLTEEPTEILYALGEVDRVVGISAYTVRPPEARRDKPIVSAFIGGSVEKITKLEPDLVIAGTFTTRPTVFLLRKLGHRVLQMPVASSLDDIRANIRRLAGAIGESARGESLIAAFDDRLAVLSTSSEEKQPLTALYWANSMTSGKGTLAEAITAAAGLRNLAVELGLAGSWQLPLETLLSAGPDALVMGRMRKQPALANETFRHPALQQGFSDRPSLRIENRYWICGTPFVAGAVERLAALRGAARLPAGSGDEQGTGSTP